MANGNKKKKRRHSPIGYILVIVIMATLMSLLIFEHFHPIRKLPAGTWIRSYDLSQETDRAIREWLHSAETGLSEVPVSTHAPVSVDIILTINADGTYMQRMDAESYNAAVRTAYSNMEASLREVISARFMSLGMAGESGLSDEEIDMLMQDAVGMSMDEYLHKAAPDIIPSGEELSAVLDRAGTCRVEEDLIYIDGGAGQVFLNDSGRLLIGDDLYTEVDGGAADDAAGIGAADGASGEEADHAQ